MKRFCVNSLVGVGVFAVSGVALAQGSPGQVTLRWSAPDECPDDARLVHQIETLLGQSLLETKGQSLAVRATAQGNTAHGYSGKLVFSSAQGVEERLLVHPSCDKLVEAIALVIALAIDPERVQTTQNAREAGAALAAPSVAIQPASLAQVANSQPLPAPRPRIPETNCASPSPPAKRSPPSLRGLRAALHGVAGAGPLPGFGGGLQAALGWQAEYFRLELLGRYWAPRDQAISAAPNTSLELGLATLGARACWLLPASAWRFSVCGGGDLGSERGRGVGVENSRSRDSAYAQFSGGFQVAYTRSRLVPEGGLEVSGALLRPRFGVRRDGIDDQVFRPEAWGFGAFIGFAFEL
ncbi:MAG: hypothetical protein ABI548_13885 [Polyangiaceae bacterium]